MPEVRNALRLALAAGLLLATSFGAAYAQDDEDEAAPASSGPKSFATFTKALTPIDGLFPLYRNEKTGAVYMAVKKEQLGKDFIQLSQTVDAAAEAGTFRGDYRSNRIIRIERHFGRLEFRAENTRFYFEPGNALSRAANANISKAVIASEPIVAASADGSVVLVDAGKLFLAENFSQVRPSDDPDSKDGENFQLGKLSDEKTRFEEVRNYPANTDFIVDYVYDNPDPTNYGDLDVTDGRYVTVAVQHSLIEIPKSNYKPRLDDYRVGYFAEERTDLTSTSAAPYSDLIMRWNLEKKDPKAALSEPVKPITFWIENTTPLELREPIRQGALAWNKAFEKAGFKNAIEVKQQPDDATWDAGDLRYNVIRFTSSPNPQFGGYGPAFTNPRTGEIIGADIMLEYVFVTNRMRRDEIFSEAGMRLSGLDDDEDAAQHPARGHGHYCEAARRLQKNLMVGVAALKASGAGDAQITRMIDEAVKDLVLHEVGHTLGLMHNMKASSIRPLAELQATDQDKFPISGSVMDYTPVNLAPKGQKQGVYFQYEPGPYDVWAVEFGYRPSLDDPKAEAERARILLARSGDPALTFGNDADDMTAPGTGIDPRTLEDDLTSDPVAWADQRLGLMNDTLATLKTRFVKPGESYQALYAAYLMLTSETADSADVLTRHIGGVYVDRAPPGTTATKAPYTPVPLATQKKAMAALSKRVFAPDAFEVSADLASYLQMQRRGFWFDGVTEDPKIHGRALNIQKRALRYLLHPSTLTRLTDTELYGNRYSTDEFLGDLTRAIFDADRNGKVNTFRQNLQTAYVERLAASYADTRYDPVARAALLKQLKDIAWLEFFQIPSFDTRTDAHRAQIRHMIDRALKAPAKA